MAVISKGQTFATGDQVTALKLNNLADNATFASGAVDNVSTQLSSGAIIVKDGGVTTAKLNNNAVTTDKIENSAVTTDKIENSAVTKTKIENLSNLKVLGNVSGGAAAPAEVTIYDEDNMSSNSATALATQQSIKAYVDAFSMKYSGASVGPLTIANTWSDLDLSTQVGSNRALVVLRVWDSSVTRSIYFRTKGASDTFYSATNFAGWGASATVVGTTNNGGTIILVTDESGVIEYIGDSTTITGVNATLVSYQRIL